MQHLGDKRGVDEISKILETVKIEEDDPFLVDPEIYADHAFLVTVSAENVEDYATSFCHSVWATSNSKTPRLKKAWFDYTSRIRKTPPLLIAASYPPRNAGTKYIHGLMIVTGPGEKYTGPNIWKEKKWDPWHFPVSWVIHCPDDKNLMNTTYDLNSKTDMTEIQRGLATLTIQELKHYLGRENNPYIRKYCGEHIYKRVEQIFSEGAPAARPKKQRPAVKIEYETSPPSPKPKADPLPPVPPLGNGIDIELGSMVDVEKIFGRTPPSPDYWDPSLNDLNFQVIDTDYCDLPSMDQGERWSWSTFSSSVAPVLRLFGATKEGHSVVAQVRCFSPYFYVRTPEEVVESAPVHKVQQRGEGTTRSRRQRGRLTGRTTTNPNTSAGKDRTLSRRRWARVRSLQRASQTLSLPDFTWAEKKRYGYVSKENVRTADRLPARAQGHAR
jgi:hypothetical protein